MKRGRRAVNRAGWTEVQDGYLRYLEEHCGVSPGHVEQHRRVVRHFVACAQDAGMSSPGVCTVTAVDVWIAQVADRGVTRHTLSHYVCAVRNFLRYLHDEGMLSTELWTHVESPRIWRESTIPSHFTWKEIEHLLAHGVFHGRCAVRDRAIFVLLTAYGLRGREVVRLRMEDVDFVRGTVTIRPRKTGKALVLPLMPQVDEALRRYRDEARPASEAREFFLSYLGRPLSTKHAVARVVSDLVARAGLAGGRSVQAIRRAVGTRLIEQGTGLAEVALVLGHASLFSTRAYIRVSMGQLREVADNYAELL